MITLTMGVFSLVFIVVCLQVVLFLKMSQTRAQLSENQKRLVELAAQQPITEHHLREQFLVNTATLQQQFSEKLQQLKLDQTRESSQLREQLHQAFGSNRARFDERQMEALKILQDTLHKGTENCRLQVKEALIDYAKELGQRMDQLTNTTETKLKEINQQVEKRLSEGFEKTNETFNNVISRLAMIDEAQKKITDLSNNVVSLQDILNDKRSRGAFGEVQLAALIHNMIPEQHARFQHQLTNNKRVDCLLILPEPSGNIAIDAKFPMENFRLLFTNELSEAEKQKAHRQFKLDIRKHIQDISTKYIIPGETADGAVMFIPSESVFAEIHANHDDLVQQAHQAKVWLVSPTTMMAILTTARAVLKDAATRKQVHEIQKHLQSLGDDFQRFQGRMDNLAKHIAQAHTDVEQVHISSKKISRRFSLIEKAEFNPATVNIELPENLLTD